MGAGGAVLLRAWACTPVRSMASAGRLFLIQVTTQLDAKELAAYH